MIKTNELTERYMELKRQHSLVLARPLAKCRSRERKKRFEVLVPWRPSRTNYSHQLAGKLQFAIFRRYCDSVSCHRCQWVCINASVMQSSIANMRLHLSHCQSLGATYMYTACVNWACVHGPAHGARLGHACMRANCMHYWASLAYGARW